MEKRPNSTKDAEKMSTLVAVTEEEARQPLLHLPPLPNRDGEREEMSAPSSSSTAPSANKQRFLSLDVFRGLTVALMILVDDAGGAFPSINHSPWFGVTPADFVMPFFLFGVGVSISLVFNKVRSKPMATKKVILRTVKLFLLGLLLQGMWLYALWSHDNLRLQVKWLSRKSFGPFVKYIFILLIDTLTEIGTVFLLLIYIGGYFHGRNHLTYGVDVGRIRWMGVLQRISIGYLFASTSEIWLVGNTIVDSPMAFVKKYHVQWMVALLLCSFYMCLLYGLYVPNWEFEAPSTNLLGHGFGIQIVNCGGKGSLEPPCNAVGLIDRFFLGLHHLYQHPVYRRTKQCSVNSPDYGPLPSNSPGWCLAPFDPEGILSSLMAAITCFLGLHFGHILVHFKDHMQRVLLWSISSFILLITGYVLELLGIPFCKPLYTLSYMCVTAGASGLFLTTIFYMVDIIHFRKATVILQWMGMNALIIYALAACDLFPAAVQGLYWGSPKNNLVDGTESLLQALLHSKKWGTLAFVIVEILFWGLVAGFLHMKGIYVRL